MRSRPTLMVVDDDAEARAEIARGADGWEVLLAGSAEEAASLIEQRSVRLIFATQAVDSDGGELLEHVRRNNPQVRRVLLWSGTDPNALLTSVNGGEVFRIVRKPISQVELRSVLQDAAARAAEIEAEVDRRTRIVTRAKREWEETFDAIRTPITIVGSDYTVVRANRACADLRGEDIKKVPGRKCYSLLFDRSEPCESCPVQKLEGTQGGESQADISALGRDFRAFAYRSASHGSVVCSYQDITEEKRRVAFEAHTEKMAALGRLAGGVAHEINNPIATIMAFVQLLKDEPGRAAEETEMLEMIEASALRCKRIVESMLKFSRRDKDRTEISPADCLNESVLLFKIQLKSRPRVRFDVEVPDGLPRVHANAGQIQQVLLNLLQNALQALPSETGSITLTAGSVGADQVFFCVSDTGTGIKPEHLEKIFDPTFSTKPVGQGTGFGMAIADAIVRDHGGSIQVDSEVGRGTQIKVQLPCKQQWK